MLPDFISVKKELDKKLTGQIRRSIHGDAVLSQIGHFTVNEGNRFEIVRPDGSSEVSGFTEHSAEVAVPAEDLRDRGISAVREVMANLTGKMQEAAHKTLYDSIFTATEAAGTTTDAKGRPFTADLYLESLEKLEFSFGDDGTWEPPTLVVHPSMSDKVAKELERLDAEADLRSQLDDLVSRKREEWRDREAHRQLVD